MDTATGSPGSARTRGRTALPGSLSENLPASASAEARYRLEHTVNLPDRQINGRSGGRAASAGTASVAAREMLAQAVLSGGSDGQTQAATNSFIVGTYGPGIGGDALGNNTVGSAMCPRKWFIRFRAEHTSPLVSVKIPFLSADYPGYGGGTGGEWRVTLHADDGSSDHFPAGLPLASKLMPASATSSNARLVTFNPAYTTTAGELYHIVIENIDPDPERNFFSINNWVRLQRADEEQLQPRFPDSDWGSGYFMFGVWKHRSQHAPIAEIAYANGASQGMSYGEASYLCPAGQADCTPEQLVGRIEGAARSVRERFTVTGGDRLVFAVGVRLLRSPGTTGDLIISLRNSMDEEIDSTTIPADAVATGPAPSCAPPITNDDLGQGARWVTAAFNDIHTLQEGETYSLRLSSTHGAYWAWVNRRLTHEYGYAPSTAFQDGWAEYTTDGTTWHPLGRVPKQNDLQFYLMTLEIGE